MYNLTDEQLIFFRENVFKISHDTLRNKLNLSIWKYKNLIEKSGIEKKEKEKLLTRICPQCKKELTYTTYSNRNTAEKKQKICKDCDNENRKIYYLGSNNPFYGKSHKQKTLKQMSNIKKGKTLSDETKELLRNQNKGTNNPMYGKTIYDIWLENYGKIEADKKLSDFKIKQSFNNKGSKNGMFGRPSPKGSGNGWSGWYKGWFFRSLMELSYMINVIERFDLKWENGELKKYKISYFDENNTNRNYFPDFIINNKYVVECKPKKLWNTNINKRKKDSALIFCEKNNLIYKMVDCPKLKTDETIKLYLDGKIVLTDKYKKRIDEIIK